MSAFLNLLRRMMKEYFFPSNLGIGSLVGRSWAADCTGFFLPQLRIALDAGIVCHSKKPEVVFVTHSHTDHIHMLTHMVSRQKPPQVYLPEHVVQLTEKYLRAAQELTNNARLLDEEYETNHMLHGVKDGDVLELKRGGKRFRVRVFNCDHSVPCVAYAFSEVRMSLKEEFRGS